MTLAATGRPSTRSVLDPCQARFANVLATRLNGDFLDLKGLSRDPGLVGVHVDFANRSFVAQLLKLIKQHMPQVRDQSHGPQWLVLAPRPN